MNIRRFEELKALGRVLPAGMAAFERRTAENSAIYSYENERVELDAESRVAFEAEQEAWRFFDTQAPSYKRVATYWVMNAKRPETKQKRLSELIAESAAGRRLRQFVSSAR